MPAPAPIPVPQVPQAASAPAEATAAPHRALAGRRVIFAANTAWYLYNYHRNTLQAFLRAGAEVHALVPDDAVAARLEDLGCRKVPLDLVPASKNPLREFQAFLSFLRAYRRVRPHAAFHFTIKCNLYGGLAAALLGVPHVNSVTGLGSAFARDGALNRLARAAYRLARRRAARVFFQSPEDLGYMRDRGLVSEKQALLLPGSGVDLALFTPRPAPERADGTVVFVLAGRLLREKGLAELAEAMRAVRAAEPGARCRVYGFLEPGDPRFVTREELAAWEAEGLLEYRGPLEDVRGAYAEADCVVLPTYYREGVPKSLLEAAAMGKPIVTTTLAGCRAVVRDGENGFLCAPRDAASLAGALRRILALGPGGRAAMGRRGREIVEAGFSAEHVTRAYLDAAAALAS